MLERATTLSATAEGPLTTVLARRRALFAVLIAGTMAAVLWLAAVAVQPHSAGAISFLVLFIVTLPWSVVGFWNAVIGFLIMRFCRDPAAMTADWVEWAVPRPGLREVVLDSRVCRSEPVIAALDRDLRGCSRA
jgi:membrane glycosyltransferase